MLIRNRLKNENGDVFIECGKYGNKKETKAFWKCVKKIIYFLKTVKHVLAL